MGSTKVQGWLSKDQRFRAGQQVAGPIPRAWNSTKLAHTDFKS